ncbi:MAG: DNA mismatch repair protein MutS [Chlamydiota bacterium]
MEAKMTPMMVQWHACKKSAKDAILLFRLGDFYEAFYDDAITAAKELELTLTKRQEIPMAGVPHHTAENYIDRLVKKGHRVAIAEQTEDPKKNKGIVKREVVRVVTPGTVVNSSLLSEKTNNFFASLSRVGSLFGLAFLDLTTAEFKVIEFEDERSLLNEIYRLRPTEFLLSEKFKEQQHHIFEEIKNSYKFMVNTQEDWHFDHQASYNFLVNHLEVHNLDGFGLKGMVPAINAAGALLTHIAEHMCLPISHISTISTYAADDFMVLDRITQRNLELTESLQDGSRHNTLLEVIDTTHTPMGGRLMRNWIKQPLLDVEKIRQRQDAVEIICNAYGIAGRLSELLDNVRDLERLMTKVSANYASPRDLVTLRFSLEQIPYIKETLDHLPSQLIDEHKAKLENLEDITDLIGTALVDEPPVRISDGGLIRTGYNEELDELRAIRKDGKSWLAQYQADLREKYDLKSLKVSYNKVFGYYIEVSKAQAKNMPETFQRRQTLVNSERFISPELKEYESKVLNAEERIASLESEMFGLLREEVAKYSGKVFAIAQAVAAVDALNALASAAHENRYVRPLVDDSQLLHIEDGRHPVIEASMFGEQFIPNHTNMADKENRLILITGPNMAGKSTYIRQVALLVILAQMGSFVPAKSAHIGLVDKVFTRIGASDDLSRGQSTFMVEMTETANILNNATNRSLVILDEIGRGTSTYDGISLAWSVAEHLLTNPKKKAKTLFATHYWELTKLEEKIEGAVNYNVAVRESGDNIVFLHKIVKGSTDKSYGIHVARLAGLPVEVIGRSREILDHLEDNANRSKTFEPSKKLIGTKTKASGEEVQLLLFEPPQGKPKIPPHVDKLVNEIKALDLDNITPMQALQLLADMHKTAKNN